MAMDELFLLSLFIIYLFVDFVWYFVCAFFIFIMEVPYLFKFPNAAFSLCSSLNCNCSLVLTMLARIR